MADQGPAGMDGLKSAAGDVSLRGWVADWADGGGGARERRRMVVLCKAEVRQ